MVKLFNLDFVDYSKEELKKEYISILKNNKNKIIFTPNAEIILKTKKDNSYFNLIKKADILLPDSVSLQYAGIAYGNAIKHRNTGVDSIFLLSEACINQKKNILLLGGAENSALLSEVVLRNKYPFLKVKGFNPGVVDEGLITENKSIYNFIKDFSPNIVVVALGAGKQEKISFELKKAFPNINIIIGAGGALEMISGIIKRAPRWMQQLGVEWVWRLYKEPKRFKRIFKAVVIFPLIVIRDILKNGNILVSIKRIITKLIKNKV